MATVEPTEREKKLAAKLAKALLAGIGCACMIGYLFVYPLIGFVIGCVIATVGVLFCHLIERKGKAIIEPTEWEKKASEKLGKGLLWGIGGVCIASFLVGHLILVAFVIAVGLAIMGIFYCLW